VERPVGRVVEEPAVRGGRRKGPDVEAHAGQVGEVREHGAQQLVRVVDAGGV
jgi:hypothetical protein